MSNSLCYSFSPGKFSSDFSISPNSATLTNSSSPNTFPARYKALQGQAWSSYKVNAALCCIGDTEWLIAEEQKAMKDATVMATYVL